MTSRECLGTGRQRRARSCVQRSTAYQLGEAAECSKRSQGTTNPQHETSSHASHVSKAAYFGVAEACAAWSDAPPAQLSHGGWEQDPHHERHTPKHHDPKHERPRPRAPPSLTQVLDQPDNGRGAAPCLIQLLDRAHPVKQGGLAVACLEEELRPQQQRQACHRNAHSYMRLAAVEG